MAEIETKMQSKVNPLANWFRQPKIYIKLPSNGEFYPEGSLDLSQNGEYPVFAMTAKDELMFKTPDALLSGQSTVEVIKSCMPAILDPWQMPSIDVDAVLMAIRIATYGENLDVTANCTACGAENTYEVSLTGRLHELSGFEYQSQIQNGPLIVHIRPYTYQEMTKASLKTFEQQRILNIVNDESISDEDKIKQFGESFVKLSELTVEIIAGCIARIDTPDGSTDDPKFIREFIDNSPKEVFEKISDHIAKIKESIDMKDVHVKCESCEHAYDIAVTIDQANFFAVRS